MKKIMFNDKYGLTQAVLNGKKTMTRRIIKAPRRTIEGKEVCGFAINKTSDGVPYEVWLTGPDEESLCQLLPTYKVGEIVAVAQPLVKIDEAAEKYGVKGKKYEWMRNKSYLSAKQMPHHIRITDIKMERLQDISNEDCMKEGIFETPSLSGFDWNGFAYQNPKPNGEGFYLRPRDAFSALIDKVSGKGTWKRNPYVFAYSFELID